MRRMKGDAKSGLVIRNTPGGLDTGGRVAFGETVEVYGDSYEGGWSWVVAKNGQGWVSRQYLVTAPAASPPRPPSGLGGITSMFGEPGLPVCSEGVVKLPASLALSWEPTQVTSFRCHKLMEKRFTALFEDIHKRGLWHLLEDFGGCFNDRPVKAGTKKSTHAWGIAVDINTRAFPLGSTKRQDPLLVNVFSEHGFLNGAAWARPDPMHFQYATGY